MNVLELDEVTYTYPGAVSPALRQASLEIAPGQLVVVAGASGSGKSTLLRIASGLVPHFHGGTFAGHATVTGLDTREHGPGELAQAVGTLFQDPETQVVMGTVRAELSFPLENRGQAAATVARAVEEAALALGIAQLLDRSTAELSGGELQRVALGAALAGRPQLVVLDEPTSQLDPVAGDELIGLCAGPTRTPTRRSCWPSTGWSDACRSPTGCSRSPAGGSSATPVREEFLEWAGRCAPRLQTPGARLLGGIGVPAVAGVKRARAALRARGLLDRLAASDPPAGAGRSGRRFGGGAGRTRPR